MRIANLRGNADYSFAVVGESSHQFELEEIAGGRTEESAHFDCIALLIPEPDNAFDPNAVTVWIDGVKVGYLPRKAAERYQRARLAVGVDWAVAEAIIVGGWERDDGDVGSFGVRLDVLPSFKFDETRDWQPSTSATCSLASGMSAAGKVADREGAISPRAVSMYIPSSSPAARAMVAGMSHLPAGNQRDRNTAIGMFLAVCGLAFGIALYNGRPTTQAVAAVEPPAAYANAKPDLPIAVVDVVPLPRPRPASIPRRRLL